MMENLHNNLPFSVVEGYKNLIRDEKTKAILNTNFNEYENYKKMKEIKNEEIGRINNLEDDLKNIKDDIDEIKLLLRTIANGSR
jgi:esterase/lipase